MSNSSISTGNCRSSSALPQHPPQTSYDERFDFGGRRYDVQTAPTASYLERHRRWQSWGVLVVGVFSTGLLGALLMLGTGYTRRVETVVDQRMRDLEATNRRLQIEVKEREQAEAALRQAQRMEAIGQLTGGVAHDFNNLLTVVSGNAELLYDNAPNDAVLRRASAIMRAAERGKRLTRQLLAFSRRQTLRPEPVDLRQRTREIADMLSRSLRTDIEVTVDMPEQLWPVAIDPAEFELAVLNIGVNARDAMPEGGRFRVTASNVTYRSGDLESDGLTGDFVAVTLSDTGTGMSPDVLAQAFEPYFTTKEAGLGSGLGLSQVYGFAKQSGGTATIDSTPGKGTSVKLLLPRATSTAGLARVAFAGRSRDRDGIGPHSLCRGRRRSRRGDGGAVARHRLSTCRGARRRRRIGRARSGPDDRPGVVGHRHAGANERDRTGANPAQTPPGIAGSARDRLQPLRFAGGKRGVCAGGEALPPGCPGSFDPGSSRAQPPRAHRGGKQMSHSGCGGEILTQPQGAAAFV